MRLRLTLCALAALSLAACQKANVNDPPAASAEAAASAAAPAADAVAKADVIPAAPPVGVSLPQLAYVYKYALAAPPQKVRGLMSKHEQVCWAAGPAVCQVVGSNVSEDGPDKISATLTLKAQPTWLRTFRAGLEDDTKAAGGRTVTADTTSDDLSGDMVDTEAALRSQVILRDRLEATLKTRKGKVSELFEMEQQLAQVRGQIDATRSHLAMMKGQVATSELRIDYRSEGLVAADGSLAPLSAAAGDVVGIFVFTLAFLIRALAVIAPVAGLGALVWWMAKLQDQRKRAAAKPPLG
ncbi:MAG: DUF4349 domain-containing protein [Alphaproteobacteria bacterium]|nr:DUF4349 domain-containing protein [Alphaproteobacteria bacterium]MBU1517085.1 DUF4349 domain-containing protein [Alphaproteobacteria bacterium]MBU2093704.1 DUF4349 domain-containing protein [Alphaproteobacteria bacterium]MBU2153974.1 DUF4349 domain-containing protein [Alphaproteobacteria bacterium]MBU2308696.1 DUF4349 domain-containing protein [Alphaproteobacteria bacterium]